MIKNVFSNRKAQTNHMDVDIQNDSRIVIII